MKPPFIPLNSLFSTNPPVSVILRGSNVPTDPAVSWQNGTWKNGGLMDLTNKNGDFNEIGISNVGKTMPNTTHDWEW